MQVHVLLDETGAATDFYGKQGLAFKTANHLNNDDDRDRHYTVQPITVDTDGGPEPDDRVWVVTNVNGTVESAHGTRDVATSRRDERDRREGRTAQSPSGRGIEGHGLIWKLPNITKKPQVPAAFEAAG